MRFLLVALPLALLAGCQPLPRPFADQAHSPTLPALKPRDSSGIMVLPVANAGAPEARQLAEALAHALRDQDVPASVDAGNRGSFLLGSSAKTEPTADGRLAVTLDWRLVDTKGAALGSGSAHGVTTPAAWNVGDDALAAALTDDAAPKIADLLSGDAAPPPAASAAALVAVRGVSGAPGDGNTALARAIVDALGRDGIAMASGGDAAPLALTCAVEVAPAQSGTQQVRIRWILSRRDGGALGHADQQNEVPAGSLDGAWADIAYSVAAAAAPGIADLVHKAEPLVATATPAPGPLVMVPAAATPPPKSVVAAASPPPAPAPSPPLAPPPAHPPASLAAAAADPAPRVPPPPRAVGDAASGQFLVQFGAYRDPAAGAKACADAAKLAPAHLVRPAVGEATWYRCRTDAALSRAAAEALIAAANSAGRPAFLVRLPPH